MPSKTRPADSAAAETATLSLQARKQEFVRDAIWTAAIDLFTEKGFEQTTVDDIVHAAGSSRRTFFRYFESKRDLMAQPVASYGDALAKAIDACPAKSSPAEMFREVVVGVAQRTVSDSRTRKVMEVAARYPAAREAQVSRIAELQDRVAAAFARRCRDEVTAHALAGLALSALSLSYRVWFSQGKRDIGSAVQHVFQEYSNAVCGR